MIEERRVKFLVDYDYKPSPRVTIAYKAGDTRLVHLACATRAVKLGKAEYVTVKGPSQGIAATIARKVKRNGQK